MEIKILKDDKELGKAAADLCAEILNEAIEKNGKARLILSTGASQLSTLNELIEKDVDWQKVEMFHLDEYIDLPESHPASFRKYLKERFVSKIPLGKAHFVVTEGDLQENIRKLSEEVTREPIDLALIGIGENAHIAFNDPPADFDTEEPYIVVELDEKCKNQQVREGWFPTIDDVPKKAVTMSAKQIMKSKVIVSCVPYKVKAQAVYDTLNNDVTNMIPATILKTHDNYTLFLDEESASLLDKDNL
ncbi:MAG: glucosamine-6-phosphate deaminase [Caldicoprobacterales bacterium]|mgnify:CR=1 FL=1|jgi:glucosamine-6-phosphate deaminase|nr:glucosamine-6-phosphate deaminase [Clostridiales bacterium]